MPQIDFDGANSLVKTDKIQGQSGTTVTVPTGHTVAITDSGGLTVGGQALGGWTFVSQIVASGASTIAFTNMASGYDYMYVTGPLIGTTDNTDFWFHLGVAGPTYRSSGYLSGSGNISSGGTSTGTANTSEGMVNDGGGAVGNATDEGISFMETILLNPAAATDTHFRTIASSRDASGVYNQCISGGMYNGAEAHTSIKYQFSGGTITGTMLQYRRSRT